jgi:hypothetical protein
MNYLRKGVIRMNSGFLNSTKPSICASKIEPTRLSILLLIVSLLVFSANCSRQTISSSLYNQELTIPGSGGLNISYNKESEGYIPLTKTSNVALNLTGTVLMRFTSANNPYIVEVKGEMQSIELITEAKIFSVESNNIKYGEISDDSNIAWKTILLTKSDKKKFRYLAFESQPKKSIRVTIFQFLGFPGLGSVSLPEQIDIPTLGKNHRIEFRKVSLIDASIPEVLYYVQKVLFFPNLDSFYRNFHSNKRAEQTIIRTEDKKEVSTKEYVQMFLESYQKEYGRSAILSDLGRVLDEVIGSVNSGQPTLTELQEQAFKVSSCAFWLCYAQYDFSSPIPRLETEEGNSIILGNPEVLLNLLYHYWINKNSNVLELPFKDKYFSIVYPF